MNLKTIILDVISNNLLNFVELLKLLTDTTQCSREDALKAVNSLTKSKFMELGDNKRYQITEQGEDWLSSQAITTQEITTSAVPKAPAPPKKKKAATKKAIPKAKAKRTSPGKGKLIRPTISNELVTEEIKIWREFMAKEYGIRNAPLNAIFTNALKYAVDEIGMVA